MQKSNFNNNHSNHHGKLIVVVVNIVVNVIFIIVIQYVFLASFFLFSSLFNVYHFHHVFNCVAASWMCGYQQGRTHDYPSRVRVGRGSDTKA